MNWTKARKERSNTPPSIYTLKINHYMYVEIHQSLGPLEGQFLANSEFFRVYTAAIDQTLLLSFFAWPSCGYVSYKTLITLVCIVRCC